LEEEEETDDGFDTPEAEPQGIGPQKPPPVTLTDQEIEERFRRDPGSLGSMSVGKPSAGALVNGVPMPAGEGWQVIEPGGAWGTQETIDSLVRCIDAVRKEFPEAPKLYIGHISKKSGGYLSPHKSHQSGRDVDIGYYMKSDRRWFARAHKDNLDLPKTWALVKAAITETDVEMLFIDASIQKLLVDHASQNGESESWLDEIFQVRGKNPQPVVRHAKGHATHLHIRFYNPVAQEMARRAHPVIVREKVVVLANYINHRARSGDTLGILARRYGTTVQAIQEANGLRSIAIKSGRVYKIPVKGKPVKPAARPASIPARRLPPKAVATPERPGAGPQL
jgi:penicillin-insensitive murein endopeptidase